MLGAAIFIFIGVDSNHFRYVLDFDVNVQGLVGDVPGGTADHSEHFLTVMFGGFWFWMACCIPIALSRMSRWVAVNGTNMRVAAVITTMSVQCDRQRVVFLAEFYTSSNPKSHLKTPDNYMTSEVSMAVNVVSD